MDTSLGSEYVEGILNLYSHVSEQNTGSVHFMTGLEADYVDLESLNVSK